MNTSELVGKTGCRNIKTLSGNHDEDIFLTKDDMSASHWELLMGCYHQGQCDDDTEEAAKYFEITDYVKAVNYLIDCGIERERFLFEGVKYPDRAKTRDEIRDESAVLQYYLWILSGDIQDNQEEN